MQTHNGKPLYYQRAPFVVGRHELVNEDQLTARHRVVYYEMCDGGDGRCKCPSRCIRAVCEVVTPNVEAQGRLTAASSPAGVPLERRVGPQED